MEKFLKTAELKELEKKVILGKITYQKMVEEINLKAYNYYNTEERKNKQTAVAWLEIPTLKIIKKKLVENPKWDILNWLYPKAYDDLIKDTLKIVKQLNTKE
jgi:hypothetical protein